MLSISYNCKEHWLSVTEKGTNSNHESSGDGVCLILKLWLAGLRLVESDCFVSLGQFNQLALAVAHGKLWPRTAANLSHGRFTATPPGMSAISNLVDDNIKFFLHSCASRLLRKGSKAAVSAPPGNNMSSLTLKSYSKAVARCRKLHKFLFLYLPKPLRLRIYTELFSNNTIQVCSFAKEHDGEFGENERCQILLTCRTIAEEACGYGKFILSRWKVHVTPKSRHFWLPFMCKSANIATVSLAYPVPQASALAKDHSCTSILNGNLPARLHSPTSPGTMCILLVGRMLEALHSPKSTFYQNSNDTWTSLDNSVPSTSTLPSNFPSSLQVDPKKLSRNSSLDIS